VLIDLAAEALPFNGVAAVAARSKHQAQFITPDFI